MEIEKICEDLRKCNNFNHCADCSFNNDIDVEIGDVQCMVNLSKCAAEVIEALQKQLAAVTAERDAAVADLQEYVLQVMNKNLGNYPCGICKHVIEEYACKEEKCDGISCWEWRGKCESK